MFCLLLHIKFSLNIPVACIALFSMKAKIASCYIRKEQVRSSASEFKLT